MENRIHDNKYSLIKSLKGLSLNSLSIISIDGVDGVGKSTLSCEIAEELRLPNIEIDNFVEEQQGGYIKHIDYDGLAESITSKPSVVVEGICVQQVLNKMNLTSDVSIYVKVIDGYGFWIDQKRLFPPEKSADEVIGERKAKGFSLGHVEDIIRYHYTFKPHENVDYIFKRNT